MARLWCGHRVGLAERGLTVVPASGGPCCGRDTLWTRPCALAFAIHGSGRSRPQQGPPDAASPLPACRVL